MTLESFINGFLGASLPELIASISGFLCLYLLIKRNIWCWFFGFIQVSLYTGIFFQAKLYSDSLLHVIYMGLQAYGWWHWRHHSDSVNNVIVLKGTLSAMLRWAVVGVVGTLLLGTLMYTYTDASFAYADAFTTSMSLVAQWLLTRRYLFNWLFWMLVDIVAIAIYWQKGLYPTAILYGTFLVMCVIGFRQWRKHINHQHPN